jgi:transmembrane 9 superfamily protein 2/4
MFLSGILPFCAVFIEFLYILNSLWSYQIYYVFGFLGAVFIILMLTTSLISILASYFALCAENYHWYNATNKGGGEAFSLVLHAESMCFCTELFIFLPS